MLDHIAYDSYGNATGESNAANGDKFKFDGMQFDAAINLYYDNARWYDPASGRFVSQDPMGFGAGDANLYRYVNNAPTLKTDPTGNVAILIPLAYIAAAEISLAGIAIYSAAMLAYAVERKFHMLEYAHHNLQQAIASATAQTVMMAENTKFIARYFELVRDIGEMQRRLQDPNFDGDRIRLTLALAAMYRASQELANRIMGQ